MTTTQTCILVLLCAAAFICAAEYKSYVKYNPIVLNSMPTAVVKCDDSAVAGHCTKWNISTKEYEAMQK